MNDNEKHLYVPNSRSQTLILLYLLGNTLFTILYVNRMNVTAALGLFVMVNIFLSLFAFLMAVKQKAYVISWGYAGLGLGAFQLLRLLWVPEEIVNPLRVIILALLILTSAAAFAASIICIKRSRERQQYIADNNIDLAILQK